MALRELMQLVLRMQAQARQLDAALASYDGWRDIPGDNAEFCARIIDNIGWDLRGIRDTLRAEMQAEAQPAQAHGEGGE